MRAGDLRHKVTIESPTDTQDAQGVATKTWATHATVWARIEPISGREYMEAAQVQSSITHRITIRYLSTVTPEMRVKHGSRYFYIESVIDVGERGREMELMVTEDV